MEKVLLGIGMEDAEELLKDAIKRNNPNHIVCDDVIIHKGREHILDKIKNNNPTVVILRESLKGNDDILQTIYLIKKHFDTRIIFIAKNRKPGDKLLATLVGYSVFDILMGTNILIEEIAKLVDKQSTIKDVIHLLPRLKDDNYDELLFESEEDKEKENQEEFEQQENNKIRNPFGIIKRDKSKDVEEKVIDVEIEDDNLDIEDIFKNAKPTKPKKIFGKDIEEYKDSLLNEDNEEIKDYDNVEKTSKTKKIIFKKKYDKEKEELKNIIDEGNENLDEQLKQLEEELNIRKDKLDKEMDLEDKSKQEELKRLQEEFAKVENLNKERDRQRKEDLKIIKKQEKVRKRIQLQEEKKKRKEEKYELKMKEREERLKKEEELKEEREKKEKEDYERKIKERELDIKEEYVKRSGVVINGSNLSTFWNISKRLLIAISVSLVVSLTLNLIMAYINGRNPYTAFLKYSNFVINLLKIVVTFLKKLFVVIGDLAKEIYIKIKNS
ncbi:hypothetical protein [uncultured Tissierella sp.]|uniref:hypothetical protein n=1 Tax=uncultured Tissierella sp. TaxID=448160 RepID=UPI002803916D|nr:hypothetical protein [uncultured Tissierella sp.]MDU5080531.1 hypothetical protein [Bacillota bacterium]